MSVSSKLLYSDHGVQEFLPHLIPILPFLSLPPELRNRIYDYAVSWPTTTVDRLPDTELQSVLRCPNEECRGCVGTIPYTLPETHFDRLSTPSLLLVNRQISTEVTSVLYQEIFTISSLLLYKIHVKGMDNIQEFIGESTLRRLNYITFEMELNYIPERMHTCCAECSGTINCLMNVLDGACALQSVLVRTRYVEPSRNMGWTFLQAGNHRCIMALYSLVSKP